MARRAYAIRREKTSSSDDAKSEGTLIGAALRRLVNES